MAWTFKVEDGTGLSDSNSYASATEGDDYHAAHLYAADWTGKNTGQKESALAMATRLIDAEFDFCGYKTKPGQALQWPRGLVPNPDVYAGVLGVGASVLEGQYFASDKIPKELKDATCELARLLFKEDRTRNPDSEGLKRVDIFQAIEVEFDKSTIQPVIHRVVAAMLSKLGTVKAGTGMAKLIRA